MTEPLYDAGQLLRFQRSRRCERIRHVTHQCGAEATKLANGFVDCGCDLCAMAGRVIFQFDDGAATADTSAMARPLQLVIADVWPAGAALRVVQPDPAPVQADSDQPRQHSDVAKIDFIRRGEVAGT